MTVDPSTISRFPNTPNPIRVSHAEESIRIMQEELKGMDARMAAIADVVRMDEAGPIEEAIGHYYDMVDKLREAARVIEANRLEG